MKCPIPQCHSETRNVALYSHGLQLHAAHLCDLHFHPFLDAWAGQPFKPQGRLLAATRLRCYETPKEAHHRLAAAYATLN